MSVKNNFWWWKKPEAEPEPEKDPKKVLVKKQVNVNKNDNANDNENDNDNKNVNGNANLNGNLNVNKNINHTDATATANANATVNIDLQDIPFEDNDQIDFKDAKILGVKNFMAGAVGNDGNVSQAYNAGDNGAAFGGFNGQDNMAYHAVQINDLSDQHNKLFAPIVKNNDEFSVTVGNHGDAGNDGGSIATGGLGVGLGKGLGVGVGAGGDGWKDGGDGLGFGKGLGGLGVGVGGDNSGGVNSSGDSSANHTIDNVNVEAFVQNITMGANIGFNNSVAANGGNANGHNLGDMLDGT